MYFNILRQSYHQPSLCPIWHCLAYITKSEIKQNKNTEYDARFVKRQISARLRNEQNHVLNNKKESFQFLVFRLRKVYNFVRSLGQTFVGWPFSSILFKENTSVCEIFWIIADSRRAVFKTVDIFKYKP